MHLHALAALSAETTMLELEPISDRDDRLRSPTVRKQHCRMIVFPRRELLRVLLRLPPDGLGGLVDLAHVLSDAGGADRLTTPATDAEGNLTGAGLLLRGWNGRWVVG